MPQEMYRDCYFLILEKLYSLFLKIYSLINDVCTFITYFSSKLQSNFLSKKGISYFLEHEMLKTSYFPWEYNSWLNNQIAILNRVGLKRLGWVELENASVAQHSGTYIWKYDANGFSKSLLQNLLNEKCIKLTMSECCKNLFYKLKWECVRVRWFNSCIS